MSGEIQSQSGRVGDPELNGVQRIGQGSRSAALDLLQAGLERRGGFDEALARAPFSRLPVRDRAFARALASTTLRRLGLIDRLLAPKLQRAPPMLVMNLLRLGAAQLLYMDTPAHAAVSTIVETAEAQRDSRPFKGLINAVLRGLERDRNDPGEGANPEPGPAANLRPRVAVQSLARGVRRGHCGGDRGAHPRRTGHGPDASGPRRCGRVGSGAGR